MKSHAKRRRAVLPAVVTVLICLAAHSPGAVSPEVRMNAIILPEVEFQDASAGDVMDFIVESCKDLESPREAAQGGISFVLSLSEEHKKARVTLKARRISLLALLRAVATPAGIPYRFEGNTVVIGAPAARSGTRLMVRVYLFPVHLVSGLRSEGAKKYLEGFGVTFPAGTDARYNGATSRLTVVNTADAVSRLDKVLRPLGAIPAQ